MIGYDYIVLDGLPWRIHQGVLLPLSMPHVQLDMDADKARLVIQDRGLVMVRWDEKFDEEKDGQWWHIIKDSREDIMALGQRARSMVRRAQKIFDVGLVSKTVILKKGYAVYQAAYGRYNTFEPMCSQSEFSARVENLVPDTEFFGVFRKDGGELVAFSENLVRDDACFYVSIWFEPRALKEFSGYLLFHEMNKYYLNEKGLKYVSDGARNISHQTNIHEFLQQKFGFRKAYADLKVVYVPWLKLFIPILYPFRAVIQLLPGPLFRKLSIVLQQEYISRSCTRQ